MARTTHDEEAALEPTNGLARVRSRGSRNDGDEAEEEGEEAPRRPVATDSALLARLERLEAENRRLRLEAGLAGLEADPERPTTAGDLLAVASAVQGQLEELREYVCREVPAATERLILDSAGLLGEEDEEGEGEAARQPRGRAGRKARTRPGFKQHQLFYEPDGSGPYIWTQGREPDLVPDDGRRRAT